MAQTVTFRIEHGDITEFKADVVALKYARGWHGADAAVADVLARHGVRTANVQPAIGKFDLIETQGAMPSRTVLLVGVPRLFQFRYTEIRDFAALVLKTLGKVRPETRHLAMTIHGPGYGLDEREALLAQLGGYLDALRDGRAPDTLGCITIVEDRIDRVRRIWEAFDRFFSRASYARPIEGEMAYRVTVSESKEKPSARDREAADDENAGVGSSSDVKPHAFVAMPFAKNMDDVYFFGIVQPVNAAGLLCERVDQAAFTGHILDQIKERIDTAAVVIADLTTANPNVYLEVGYAWGRGRPTILLVQSAEELKFDVASQKCLIYERIIDLTQMLSKELQYLQSKGVIPAKK